MFYRWAKRLESMQLPETAFPAAAPEPYVETEDSHELDGALIAAAIASLWVLVQSGWSPTFVGMEWAFFTCAPIFLVALLGALLLRPQAPVSSIVAHIATYGGSRR